METTNSSDANLVAESLTGDRDAFGRIVARYQTLVCSLTYASTGSLSQSEDLAQETFVAAWKQLGSLREPQKLRAWLCGIARNLTYDALKRQGREPSHAAETIETFHELPEPGPEPAAQAINREEEALLWRSLERIPQTYREPLTLFYREHQSVARVAEALDLNEDAVKQRLSRGRKLLHDEVAAFVEGALERTAPGNGFTLSVLSTLPATTVSAKLAGAGAVGAKTLGLAVAKSALVFPLAVFGNYFGYRAGMDSAQSDLERNFIKSFYKRLMICVLGFSVLLIALNAWVMRLGSGHEHLAASLVVGFVGLFILATLALGWSQFRGRRVLLARLAADGNARQMPPAWEYRSRAVFLGMPLVHIRVGGNLPASSGRSVRAWIAAGDCAIGGLFAFGGLAVAPLSIGGLAVGLLPFGGCTVGLLALGGMSVGLWSFGGIAVGWDSFGGCALAWNAAAGSIALAWNYALGNVAIAAQANDDIAKAICNANTFFRGSSAVLPYISWMNLLWILPMIQWWRVNRRAARKAASSSGQ